MGGNRPGWEQQQVPWQGQQQPQGYAPWGDATAQYQPQDQAAYPPGQPPQQPPRQQRPWMSRHPVITGLLGTFLFIIAVSVGASIGSGGKTSANPAPTVTVTVTAAPAAPTKAASGKKTAAKAVPAVKTVATFSGSGGGENTPQFTTASTWKLAYSFDCSNYGMASNFMILEDGSYSGVTVNDLAMSRATVTWAYNDAGTHYLSVTTSCAWTVKIIDEG